LNLGCGNSILCEDMWDEGYKLIWNMDISSVCIQQMGDRNRQSRPEMKWEVMDCRDLKYETGTFDLIVDKSTIDALLCGNFAYLNVAIMLKECQRVLKTGGYYMAVSYGVPDNREFHLIREHLKFELNTYKIEKKHPNTNQTSVHYIYVAKKLPEADKHCEKNWPQVMNQIRMEMEDDQLSELTENENDAEGDKILHANLKVVSQHLAEESKKEE
jgi:EEF1A lysine methyltransferase 4